MSINELQSMSPIPFSASRTGCKIAVAHAGGSSLSGEFWQPATHHRFELEVSHLDGTAARFSVSAAAQEGVPAKPLSDAPRPFHVQLAGEFRQVTFRFKQHPEMDFSVSPDGAITVAAPASDEATDFQVHFDVSDLVYYIGHHDNLTGIQRVQACVLLGLIEAAPEQARGYLSYDNRRRDFIALDPDFFESLLRDLALPAASRKVKYDPLEARLGILPKSIPLSAKLVSTPNQRTFIYLLGAAWVNRDYFNRILDLKRSHGAQFCMTIHDLIPIYARETCDQGTAIVFEEFLRRSFQFTDCFYTVSEYTAYDLLRFAKSIGIDNVPVSVVENGHTLDSGPGHAGHRALHGAATQVGRSPFVLFVSTVEGRKNHSFIFDVWAELARTMPAIPTLVCVGRFGWRAEQFLEKMLATGNLSNRIKVLSDVSDTELEALYDNCLFTVYPSAYEGWGLPVGESLSRGKLCVVSDRSSLPEVAGRHGIYIDPDDVPGAAQKIRRLVEDDAYRSGLEKRLLDEFVPRTWDVVATEIMSKLSELPAPTFKPFPLLTLGTEYKSSRLPSRNVSSLGVDMLREISNARRGPLTNQACSDVDILAAQAMRSGRDWYEPEEWGTWCRYPGARKLFHVRARSDVSQVVIYEKIRVVPLLVGQKLRVVVNGGAEQEFQLDAARQTIRLVCSLQGNADGIAQVDLRYELSRISSAQLDALDAIDPRRLGIGFESTYVLDEADLGARLLLLERMMFEREGAAGAAKLFSGLPTMGRHRAREASSSAPLLSAGESITLDARSATQAGVDVGQLLLDGWGQAEAEGVWSVRESATFEFRLADRGNQVKVLWMNMRCLASPERPVEVSILVNGEASGVLKMVDQQAQRFQVMLPAAPGQGDPSYEITLLCDRLASPSKFGTPVDERKLGVSLSSMGISSPPSLEAGQACAIARGGATEFLSSGWYEPEEHGVWSGRGPARILCPLAMTTATSQTMLKLTVKSRLFGASILRPSHVDVMVHDQVVARWTFRHSREASREALVPITFIDGQPFLDATFVCRSPVYPRGTRRGTDSRNLGLFLSSISYLRRANES